jgi:hypothetical protein
LPHSRWRTVLDSQEAVAESLLESSPFLPLTDERAVGLVGEFSLPVSSKAKPFLIRAAGSRIGTAGFEVHVNQNGNVTVIGGALSHYNVPPERRPVVVWLDRPPREVYLWFSVAE